MLLLTASYIEYRHYAAFDGCLASESWENAMRRINGCLFIVLLLSGCLSIPPEQTASVPTPVCNSPKQCEAMWAAAQAWVSLVGKMQLSEQSPDSITTFRRTPGDPTTMTGTVIKRARPDGYYELVAQFDCESQSPSCAKLRESGVALFNTMVSAAGQAAGV
jgi:hypothetical protein